MGTKKKTTETSYERWIADPENREKLNKRRRDRYNSDPELREKQKKWSADARKKARKDRGT